MELKKKLFENLQYHELSPGNFSQLDNSSGLGGVSLGIADFFGAQIAITEERQKILSFSSPFKFDRSCFFVNRQFDNKNNIKYFYFFNPFTASVWFSLIAIFILILISFKTTLR